MLFSTQLCPSPLLSVQPLLQGLKCCGFVLIMVRTFPKRGPFPLALSLSLFHMTPLGSRLPGKSCLEGWLTRIGRGWFSALTVANHITHGCHPSSLTSLARVCWKSLRRPHFLPLKLDPTGFCALKSHLLFIPDHVMSQLFPIMSHLASQDAPDWEKFP